MSRRYFSDTDTLFGEPPLPVCDFCGWSDLETFSDHYKGKFSPEAQRKQRQKVDWL